MRIKMYGSTNIGKTRKQNQDAIFYDERLNFGVVADGIGGRNGGEVASQIAVQGMRSAVMESDMIRHDQVDSFLVHAIDRINAEIIERGRQDEAVNGMGTTINGIMFIGDRMHVVHVGDSRTYMFYKDHLFQLTIDHNVRNFIKRRWLLPSDLTQNAKQEALVKALGLLEVCESDIYTAQLKAGQIFLTCSDGLYSMVEDEVILQILQRYADRPNELPKRLIDEANMRGGKDNITVLLSVVKAA